MIKFIFAAILSVFIVVMLFIGGLLLIDSKWYVNIKESKIELPVGINIRKDKVVNKYYFTDSNGYKSLPKFKTFDETVWVVNSIYGEPGW